jgi:AraC-like DNA-binding protein
MRPVLDTSRGVRLVWEELAARPGRRPRPVDLARRLGRTLPQLRRDQRANRAAPVGTLITYGCVAYAVRLIANGVKCEAAMRLVGFRNRSNFNHDVRDYFGYLPHDLAPPSERMS